MQSETSLRMPMLAAGVFDLADGQAAGLAPCPLVTTVSVYCPGRGAAMHFNHAPLMGVHQNRLHMMWGSSPKDEDTHDTRVLYASSADGKTWTTPRVLISGQLGEGWIRTIGAFWSDADRLLVFTVDAETWYAPGEKYTRYAQSLDGGETFSDFQPVLDDRGEPVRGCIGDRIKQLPSGRLIAPFNDTDSHGLMLSSPYYTDDPTGLTGWRRADFPMDCGLSANGSQARPLEGSCFLRPDGGIVMLFRDMMPTGSVLCSVSLDGGESYSPPAQFFFPDCGSMQCCGNLPDGTAYIINNPNTIDRGKRRVPLSIALSRDGILFDRAVLIRGGDSLQPMAFEGLYKSAGFSYPGSLPWRDTLYVAYGTNKEDIDVSAVPLSALARSETEECAP